MKKSALYVSLFMFFFTIMVIFVTSILYPNVRNESWRLSLGIFAALTAISFLMSWLSKPGYLKKAAEGEFLLLLIKFDP